MNIRFVVRFFYHLLVQLPSIFNVHLDMLVLRVWYSASLRIDFNELIKYMHIYFVTVDL